MVIDIKNLILSLEHRLKTEASRRNSSYDYYGMDNTQESVDPNVYLAILALKKFRWQFEIDMLEVK